MLYYIRRDFFPSKEVDYNKIKIHCLAGPPVREEIPLAPTTNGPSVKHKIPTTSYNFTSIPMGDEAPGAGGLNLENLDMIDNEGQVTPPADMHDYSPLNGSEHDVNMDKDSNRTKSERDSED